MSPNILTLFNCLTDGVAIIASDAKLRFANTAMLKLLPAKPGSRFPHEAVAAMISQALEGHLSLPHQFEAEIAYDLHIASPERLLVHVLHSPVGKDVVVVVRNLTEAALYETTVNNLCTLIEGALSDPLRQFSEDFTRLLAAMEEPAAGPAGLSARRAALVAQGEAVLKQLNNLVSFAHRGSALAGSDRIVLEHWLTEALARSDASASTRSQRLLLESTDKALPVIYGSAHWLGLAIDACLDNAIGHSANGTDIVLSAIGCGNHVRITVRNNGRGLQAALLRKRLMRPLMRGEARSALRPGLGLGLPLARHIVELHHGRLALEQEPDGFVSCTIELPAGGVAHTPAGLDPAQVQRYATDLVRLRAQRRPALTPPPGAALARPPVPRPLATPR